jgi:hypothetical protein
MGGFAAGLSQGLEQARDRQIQAQQLQLQQDMAKGQQKAMESEDQLRQLNIQSLLKRVADEQKLVGMRGDLLGGSPTGAPMPGAEGPMPNAPPELDRSKLASFLQASADAGQNPDNVLALMAIGDPRIAAIKESLQPPKDVILPEGSTYVRIGGKQQQPQSNKQPLGQLGTEVQGKTGEGRPIIKNPDGSVSTERTITVTHQSINGGRPTNIPSMFGGKEVSEEEAVKRIAAAGGKDPETGKNLPGFNSIQEAVEAAEGRSAELGKQYGNDAEQQYQGRLERDQALEVDRNTPAGDAQIDFVALGNRTQAPQMPPQPMQQQPQPAAQMPQPAQPMPQAPQQAQPSGPAVQVLAKGAPKHHAEDKPMNVAAGGRIVDPKTGQVIYEAPAAPPKPPDFGDRVESAAAIYMKSAYGIDGGNMAQLIAMDPISAEKVRQKALVDEPVRIAGAKADDAIDREGKQWLGIDEANKLGVEFGTTKAQAKGILPLTTVQRESMASFDTARIIIDDIDQYSKKVNKAPGGAMGRLEQGSKLWGAYTQSDPDAAMLQSKAGELARLARSMGEKGAMAEGDIARSAALVPGVTDTKDVAVKKIQDLKSLIDQAEGAFRDSVGLKKRPANTGTKKPVQQEDPTTANIPVPKNLSPKQQEIFKQEYLRQRQKVQGEMQKGTTNAAQQPQR